MGTQPGQKLKPLRCPKAARALADEHFGLACWFARQWKAGRRRQEVYGAAWQGLYRAAELYDQSRGCKFSTYAMLWMRVFVMRNDDESKPLIRIPDAMGPYLKCYRLAANALSHRLGREPTQEEILDAIPNGRRFSGRILDAVRANACYDATHGHEDANDFAVETLDEIEAADEAEWARQSIERWMADLKKRDQDILRLRYMSGLSYASIGRVFGITQERVRQKHQALIRKLHEAAKLEHVA